MKPNKVGLWEWTNDGGEVITVPVVDVGGNIGVQWFRVYYRGGYYNVNDEEIGTPDEEYSKAEWPDRWGNYVGVIDFELERLPR